MAVQGGLYKAFNVLKDRIIYTNRSHNISQFSIFGAKATDPPKTEGAAEPVALPQKPKKPPTTFFAFVADAKAKQPNVIHKELIVKCSEAWKTLDSSEKDKYQQKYKAQHEDYKIRLNEYNNSLTPEQKQMMSEQKDIQKDISEKRLLKQLSKKFDKPKQPMSPYAMYVLEQQKITNRPYIQLTKELKEEYANLPVDVRQKYVSDYEANREKFRNALREWKLKMVEAGHDKALKINKNKLNKEVSTSRARDITSGHTSS